MPFMRVFITTAITLMGEGVRSLKLKLIFEKLLESLSDDLGDRYKEVEGVFNETFDADLLKKLNDLDEIIQHKRTVKKDPKSHAYIEEILESYVVDTGMQKIDEIETLIVLARAEKSELLRELESLRRYQKHLTLAYDEKIEDIRGLADGNCKKMHS